MKPVPDPADPDGMALFQVFSARPALTPEANELAVVIADGAKRWHPLVVREFGSAGGAYRISVRESHIILFLTIQNYHDIGLL